MMSGPPAAGKTMVAAPPAVDPAAVVAGGNARRIDGAYLAGELMGGKLATQRPFRVVDRSELQCRCETPWSGSAPIH
jgi:hypothetical protein